MTDFLYSIDLTVFYFINHTISNPIFDKFFPFITNPQNWLITGIIFWFILFIKGGRIGKIAAITIIFLIVISDQISSQFLKHLFGRIRPNNALTDVHLLVRNTKSFSFPSSHAVNNFAVATFLSRIYPNLKWIFFTIASLVAFSRPYVGVHYPSDIIAGALIGAGLGYIFAIIARRIDSFLVKRKIESEKS
jgi:undecaprenyl-diphosphatase